jgi:hypothetical protein
MVSTDAFWKKAIFLLVLVGLMNQILTFVVGIPANPMKEGKAIHYRNTDLRAKFTCSSCFATNDGSNLSLYQVDDPIRNAARLGVEQDALLTVQLADHEKFLPPMRLEARKACPGSDQSVYGIKIPL